MPSGVELQIQLQMDEMAAWKQSLVTAVAGRTLLWNLIDAAQDIPYENRLKGATIYAVDQRMNNPGIGTSMNDWFSLHRDYFQQDVPSLASFQQALTTWRWRASQYWNQLFNDTQGNYLLPSLCFPRPDLNLGSFLQSTNIFTDGLALENTQAGMGKISAVAAVTIGASTWTLTATLKRGDGTTINLQVTFAATAPLNTAKVFGEQLLTSDVVANATVLPVAATTQFYVGDPVLIQDSQQQEVATVNSINAGVSITLAAGTRWPYATARTAKVTPLFQDVTACTQTGGTSGDQANFRFAPDRVVTI